MKSKITTIYLDSWNNPVDLESIDSSAGKIEFNSISEAVDFITSKPVYELIEGEFYGILSTYNSIQKKLKRYGYFKAYGIVNNLVVSFMIK